MLHKLLNYLINLSAILTKKINKLACLARQMWNSPNFQWKVVLQPGSSPKLAKIEKTSFAKSKTQHWWHA